MTNIELTMGLGLGITNRIIAARDVRKGQENSYF